MASEKYGVDLGLHGIRSERITNLRFADDVLLVARSLKQAQQMLIDLDTEAKKVGLDLHHGKPKY